MSNTRPRLDETGSGSGFSDLSALESDTDTLGRAILRHERDARRIQAVLHGPSRSLNRAMPRTPLSQRLQRSRQTQEKQPEAVADRRPLVERRVIDTTLNTARTWGRRQRPQRHWTHHDKDPQSDRPDDHGRKKSSSTEKDDDEDAIVPHRTAFTGDNYLGRSDRFAIALSDDTPPSMKRYRPPSEPSSMRHMNSSVLDDERGYREEVSPIRQVGRATVTPSDSLYATSTSAHLRQEARASPLHVAPYRDFSDDEDKENVHTPPGKSLAQPTNPQFVQRRGLEKDERFASTHARSDSIQLLERLAKVSSSSPNPGKALAEAALTGVSQSSGHPSHDTGSGSQPAFSRDAAPQPEEAISTPVVTGGWVETPKQDGQTSTRAPSQQRGLRETVLTQQPRPSKVNTVNTALQGHALLKSQAQKSEPIERTHHDQRPLASRPDSLSTEGQSVQAPPSERPPQVVKNSSSPARTVTSPARTALVANSTARRQSERAPKRVTFDLNRRTICEHCGGGYGNVWEALWIELRSNFYVRDSASFATVHLTWLGAVVLAWVCWYVLECLLCKWYCKPMFAHSMDDYGADASAPKYPLVIPTLLLRPFESAWRPLANWLTWISGVTFHWIFGEGARDYTIPAQLSHRTYLPNGFDDDAVYATKSIRPARWTETATSLAMTSSRRAIASVIDAIDELGRAWED